MMRKPLKLKIFDLDRTVINSDHRYNTLENGDIDLGKWIENCTSDKIEKDFILPFARHMKECYETKGTMVAICTARVMGPFDWRFLNDHSNEIPFHYAMHRPEGCRTGDAELKKLQILKLCNELELSPFALRNNVEIFDDNPTVLKMAYQLGIKAHCSLKLNEQYRKLA